MPEPTGQAVPQIGSAVVLLEQVDCTVPFLVVVPDAIATPGIEPADFGWAAFEVAAFEHPGLAWVASFERHLARGHRVCCWERHSAGSVEEEPLIE